VSIMCILYILLSEMQYFIQKVNGKECQSILDKFTSIVCTKNDKGNRCFKHHVKVL